MFTVHFFSFLNWQMWLLFCKSLAVWRWVWGSVMMERRGVCLCVCVFRKRERWQDGQGENAAADCDVSGLFWHDYVTFQCRTPSCPERERERERSTNNAYWVLWGGSWWDVEWPKGDLFRPGWGASYYPAAFTRLEVDGWSVFILVRYCSTGLSSRKWKRSRPPPYQTNQGFSRRTTENQGWWRWCKCLTFHLMSMWWR